MLAGAYQTFDDPPAAGILHADPLIGRSVHQRLALHAYVKGRALDRQGHGLPAFDEGARLHLRRRQHYAAADRALQALAHRRIDVRQVPAEDLRYVALINDDVAGFEHVPSLQRPYGDQYVFHHRNLYRQIDVPGLLSVTTHPDDHTTHVAPRVLDVRLDCGRAAGQLQALIQVTRGGNDVTDVALPNLTEYV